MGILTEDYSNTVSTGDIVGQMPQRMMERDLRRLMQKKMAGEPLSPAEEQAVSRHQSFQSNVGEPTAMEITGVPGFARAAKEAYDEPSIGNAANAGMRGAMLAFRPLAALGFAGAGYADAASKDLGLLTTAANAEEDGLTAGQRKRLKYLESQRKLSMAERQEQQLLIGIQKDFLGSQSKARFDTEAKQKALEAEAKAREAEMQRGEYDRAVRTAESTRARIEGTNKSFKDSEVGKFYEKTGGLTPVLAGLGAGMIGRAAHGPGTTLATKMAPAAEGTGAAFATMNAPLVYDSFSTPTMNPERQALEAYSRELPPGHPRKEEFAGYAQQMSELNPVQQNARNELFSPMGNLRRFGASMVEGGLAGVTGGNLLPAARRMIQGTAEIPGALATGYNRGMTQATEAGTGLARARGLLAEETGNAALAQQAAIEARRGTGGPTGGLLTDPPISAAPAAVPVPTARPAPQPAPAQSQTSQMPALPAPKEPREWVKIWSQPARESLEEITSKGVSLSSVSAPALTKMIAAKLPPGSPVPAEQTVRGYLRRLRKVAPDKATPAQLKRQWSSDPGRNVFGIGGPAIGMGLLTMGNDE